MNDSLVFSSAEIRAFLLGTLACEKAEQIEEKFVLDSAFFSDVEAAEYCLITEYLDDCLNVSDRACFAKKYLTNRELSAKVDFARNLKTAVRTPRRHYRKWSFAAGAIAATVLLALLVRYPARHAESALVPEQQAADSAVTVHLTPGVEKGSSAAHRISVGSPIRTVELDLSVPGARIPYSASLEVFRFLDHGTDKIATSVTPGQAASDGVAFVLRIPTASLPTGDYVIYLTKASTPSAEPSESFVFSVVRR